MPKKPPQNAFYFFMVDFKDQQRKQGINYGNMAAVAEAAGPAWKDAPPAVRSKFEAIAKKEKAKRNIPEMKFTSDGISFAEIDRRQQEARDAEERQKTDIVNKVKSKIFSGDIKEETFYVMDVNWYCRANLSQRPMVLPKSSGLQRNQSSDLEYLYIVCEMTLLRFNLIDGILDVYHEIINPGKLPIGYGSDAKLACEEFGMDMPDETNNRTDYFLVLANIIDYLSQKEPSKGGLLPIIYTLPDKVAPVKNFIQQLCRMVRPNSGDKQSYCLSEMEGEEEPRFRVYRLDTLFYELINGIRSRPDEGFPAESLAMMQLKKDSFKFNPGLACEHHEERAEKLVECTQSRVRRWSYTVLDHCCPVAGVTMRPGQHLPLEFDTEAIEVVKEKARERAGPSVALSSCNSSVIDSFDHSVHTADETASSVNSKRTLMPSTMPVLRDPKINYANRLREAPNLCERDFPKLTISAGRGRGCFGKLSK